MQKKCEETAKFSKTHRLELRFFGNPVILLDGNQVHLETRKALALLAYLAETSDFHRRESLITMFWPESGERQGRNALRATLYSLNKALTHGYIQSGADSIRFDAAAEVWFDTGEFQSHLSWCRQHDHIDAMTCDECLCRQNRAVALYRGDFLKGFSTRKSADFEDWQFLTAESYRRDLGTMLEKLVGMLSARGLFQKAIDYASRWIALDPLHERAHMRLMELYARAGFRSAALRQYQECTRILREELGCEPLESTASLYETIREGNIPEYSLDHGGNGLNPLPGLSSRGQLEVPGEKIKPEEGAPEYRQRLATVIVLLLRKGASQGFAELIETTMRSNDAQITERSSHRVVVVLGGSQTREGDPESALRIVFKLRKDIHARGWEITVGVNIGNVYMASSDRGNPPDIVAAGVTVSAAFQLAANATDGQILVSGSVYRFTRDSWTYAPWDKAVGLDNEVSYRALRPAPRPQKTRGIEGLRTRLIGREYEMLRLRGAVQSLLRGNGGIVDLIGEAGIGKSRLLSELHAALLSFTDGDAIRWLEGRCLQQSQATAYRPFIEMVEQLFGWTADTARTDFLERIEKTIAEMNRHNSIPRGYTDMLSRMFSKLLGLYGDEGSLERAADHRGEAMHRETISGIRTFLQALSIDQPLIVIFEDLHWADGASMDMLFHLMESVKTSRMLIICGHRPDRKRRCSAIPSVAGAKFPDRFVELHLKRLSPEQSQDMAKSLLQTGDLPDEIQSALLEGTEGVPFFIEEITQSFIDTGALYFNGSSWTLNPKARSVLPQPIQQVVLGRIDTLPHALRTCLDAASVIGSAFSRRLLEYILEMDTQTEELLWELQDIGVIYQERVIPEEEFSFRHVLTREAVYDSIPPQRRRVLHATVAEAMETLYASSLELFVEQLALHYERARKVDRAIGYLYRAGTKALMHYANEEAISFLSRGLDLLQEIPDSREKLKRELEFRTALGIPLVPIYGHGSEEVMDVYQKALDICEQVGDNIQLFHCLHGIRRFYLVRGELDRCEVISRRIFDLTKHIERPEFVSRGNMVHAETLFNSGKIREAVELAAEGARCSRGEREDLHISLFGNATEVLCLAVQATSLSFLGFPERAALVESESVKKARDIGHPFTLCAALLYSGFSRYHLGDSEGELLLADELFELASKEQFTLFIAAADIFGGWAAAMAKNSVDACISIRRVYSDYGPHHRGIMMRFAAALLAEALERTGDPMAGIEPVENEIEKSASAGGNVWLPTLYRLRGKLYNLAGEDLSKVSSSYQKGIEIAQRYGVRLEALRSSLELADLLWEHGSKQIALKTAKNASSIFESDCTIPEVVDARRHLEKLNGLMSGAAALNHGSMLPINRAAVSKSAVSNPSEKRL